MHVKAEGMAKFDIFHVYVENSVNSELCFFSKQPKSEILSKNAAQKTSSNELKTIFDPSL